MPWWHDMMTKNDKKWQKMTKNDKNDNNNKKEKNCICQLDTKSDSEQKVQKDI